jgi:hypothetical protein
MKKIFTFSVLIIIAAFSNAQAVLNELYTDPGSGKQEFFELYNSSSTPENLDNYTLVTYYEEPGGKTGFYVLDFPNQTIAANGYYAGASASPFNVQSQTGVIPDFNWNAMPAGGSLTKWQKSGSGYIQVAVPVNLNDLFDRITGSGDVYHTFLYKNGILTNGLMCGTNAQEIAPYIKAMPDLFVNMNGASFDFTISFSTIKDTEVEYVIPVTGSDNGYIRDNDGKCASWIKSSAQVAHTPGVTNGSYSPITGDITIAAIRTYIEGDLVNSLLQYNITAGPLTAFPVVVEVYHDLGITGQLDIYDVLVDSRSIASISTGTQNIILPFRDDPILLIVKSVQGCFNKVLDISSLSSPLLVHLNNFQGNMNKNNKVTLSWTVADNETVDFFEVEKSVNGKDFAPVALVFATEKNGNEDYLYFETINMDDKVMFRLKMFDKGRNINYSKVLVFQSKSSNTNGIKILGNPVNDKLTFSYTADANQMVIVKVNDLAGKTLMNQKIKSFEGSNMMSLSLGSTFTPGMYIVEVSNGIYRQIAKFIKQ